MQLALCFMGTTGAVKILDVTDKSRIREISTFVYPGAAYSHQGWLSASKRYLYVDDSFDDATFGGARTRILDIAEIPYQPTQYRRLIKDHGSLGAARLLNHRPVSDDSLGLAARRRPDLTLESLLCRAEWLGLRPLERVLFVAKLTTSGLAVKLPIDFDAVPVHPAVPSPHLLAQSLQIRDSSGT